jgi:hypothetical protein
MNITHYYKNALYKPPPIVFARGTYKESTSKNWIPIFPCDSYIFSKNRSPIFSKKSLKDVTFVKIWIFTSGSLRGLLVKICIFTSRALRRPLVKM